jgi:hypothetical protein
MDLPFWLVTCQLRLIAGRRSFYSQNAQWGQLSVVSRVLSAYLVCDFDASYGSRQVDPSSLSSSLVGCLSEYICGFCRHPSQYMRAQLQVNQPLHHSIDDACLPLSDTCKAYLRANQQSKYVSVTN